jgi:hypothetical protein
MTKEQAAYSYRVAYAGVDDHWAYGMLNFEQYEAASDFAHTCIEMSANSRWDTVEIVVTARKEDQWVPVWSYSLNRKETKS